MFMVLVQAKHQWNILVNDICLKFKKLIDSDRHANSNLVHLLHRSFPDSSESVLNLVKHWLYSNMFAVPKVCVETGRSSGCSVV